MCKEDYLYKRKAVKAATELGYSENVIAAIKNCVNANEISRIMKQAREGVLK